MQEAYSSVTLISSDRKKWCEKDWKKLKLLETNKNSSKKYQSTSHRVM